ncbi:MAG: TonB-dependent receptor [Bacteroidota bacterium]
MKPLSNKYIYSCLVALMLGINSTYGQIDTTANPDNISLKELLMTRVTTVSKTSQSLDIAPATVMVITREQIRARGYQSLLDVMYDLPDIKVDDKIYSVIRNTFTIRGTQGQEKFVILLDGIRINSPTGEAMPIMENYPVNVAEQIEIVFGPASALYGADAVSGVINIITKKNLSKKDITVEASSVAGTYGYTNNTLLITKKITDRASIVVSGQYSYDKGVDYSSYYKDDSALSVASYNDGTLNSFYGPYTPVTPISSGKYQAPLEAYNIYASLRLSDFSFTFFRNDFTIPTSFGSNTSNAIYNKDVYMRQSIQVADANYKKTIGKITSTSHLTSSQYNLHPGSNYRNLYTSMERAYKYSFCSMVRGEEQLDYIYSDKLQFTGGISLERYSTLPQSTDLNDPVNTDDYIHGSYRGTKNYYSPDGLDAQFYFLKYTNVGTYLQAQYAPVKKINITLGARYDINSRYGKTFNPRVGIVYKPNEKTTIKALYGRAFLAPTGSDSYAQYGSFDTQDSGKTFHSYFLHLPNPELKPLISKNAEMSIHQYLSNNFSITLDGYFTSLSGLHALADDNTSTHLYNNSFKGIPVDYIEVFINAGKQENYGGSIQLNYKWSAGRIRASSYATLSYVNGKINSAEKESEELVPDLALEFISPFMLHGGTDLKSGKFIFSTRFTLLSAQHIAGTADTLNNIIQRQEIPGYILMNLSLRYNITKTIAVFANVKNALNQRYRNTSFNMDLNKDTDVFHGQPEDPMRIQAGINVNL